MNKEIYYKWLFILAGMWSFIVSIIGFILKQIDPTVAWLVIAFGVGFFCESGYPPKSWGDCGWDN